MWLTTRRPRPEKRQAQPVSSRTDVNARGVQLAAIHRDARLWDALLRVVKEQLILSGVNIPKHMEACPIRYALSLLRQGHAGGCPPGEGHKHSRIAFPILSQTVPVRVAPDIALYSPRPWSRSRHWAGSRRDGRCARIPQRVRDRGSQRLGRSIGLRWRARDGRCLCTCRGCTQMLLGSLGKAEVAIFQAFPLST